MHFAAKGLPRLGVLDGFRALAILIVMTAHSGFEKFVPGGFGVTIFFFLSGYLITSWLRVEAEQNGHINLKQFYIRRILRLLPPLYVTILFVILCIFFDLIPSRISFSGFAADALFVTNYAQPIGAGPGLPIALWSLNVEEHFYLVFSAVFAFFLIHRSSTNAARWCLASCALILCVRIISVMYASQISDIYYHSHTRIDSILFGCCLALTSNPALDQEVWRPKIVHITAATFVLLLCLIIRSEIFRQTIRYSLQGLSLFVIFSAALQYEGVVVRLLRSVPLRIVAALSYTLYLIHMPMLALVKHGMGIGDPSARSLMAVGLSVAYAGAMYVVIERPLAERRRRLHGNAAKKRSGQGQQAVSERIDSHRSQLARRKTSTTTSR
jgi:peptidoglycan/LPS O-acetylase OafA/YrhL